MDDTEGQEGDEQTEVANGDSFDPTQVVENQQNERAEAIEQGEDVELLNEDGPTSVTVVDEAGNEAAPAPKEEAGILSGLFGSGEEEDSTNPEAVDGETQEEGPSLDEDEAAEMDAEATEQQEEQEAVEEADEEDVETAEDQANSEEEQAIGVSGEDNPLDGGETVEVLDEDEALSEALG
jgi:hypothetical protein